MPEFNETTAGLSDIKFNFVTWLDREQFPVRMGDVPEPSDALVEGYFARLKEIFSDSGVEDAEGLSDEEAAELADEFDYGDMRTAICENLATLCQGSPSADMFKALPTRVRQLFTKWLLKQVQDPELSASVTKPSRAARRGGK